MDNKFIEKCKNKDFCFEQILEARRMFGDINSTETDYSVALERLTGCLLYGPEEVTVLIESTIQEMGIRLTYLWFSSHRPKKEIEETRFLQWPKGTHWYAKIGVIDVVDKEGNMKWDTKEEAERASKWFRKYKLGK